MLDTKKNSHPIYDHFSINPKDYDAADGSSGSVDDGTLTKRWIEGRRALFQLENRGTAQARKITCDDGKNQRTVRYQSQPYPSIGAWPNDADQVENARDLQDWNNCHTSQISTYNLGGDRDNYATEHTLELESMELFWLWATNETNKEDKCKDIDCIFLADFFNKKVLDNPTNLPRLDASHQAIPMQRVMEVYGSEERTENFAILHKTINLNKAQLWRYFRPRKLDTWDAYVKNDRQKALELVRDTIAVYNYMKDPDVWEKFKAINVDVRDELQKAQDQYKKTNGKDISLLECYDAWMDYQMESFVTKGKKWVDDAIARLKKDWKPVDNEQDDPLGNENYKALEEILDLLEGEAKDAIATSNFDLDSGDSMDTSDG